MFILQRFFYHNSNYFNLRWLPIVFCPRASFQTCTTPKLRAGSRSKMPTKMLGECVDRLLFQNICQLNRRPQLSLLDVKEKYPRHAGVSTNEADLMRFVRSPRSSRGTKQDGIFPVYYHTVLGVVCGVDTNAKI